MGGMISLVVCAGLSLNLILHFGLGVQGVAEGQEDTPSLPLFEGAAIWGSVMILWCLASYVLSPLSFGFLEYVLLFPLASLFCMGFEYGAPRFFPSLVRSSKRFNPESGYNGLAPTALVLTLHLAGTLFEALILSLSFVLGTLLAILLLRYIRIRSALERVPRNLRGPPLLLIAMGLLSLLFTSLTAIFFTILGIF
jgi:electron transport complex protein RnfA